MTTRIRIVCADDTIWSLPCWDRTIAYLQTQDIVVEECILTHYSPSIGRVKESATLWYIKRFGIWNFGLMAAFAILSRVAAIVTGAPRDYDALCSKYGIALRRFASVKDEALLAHFQHRAPDIVAIMVPEIVPAALIACCTRGMINQHPSLLPSYRGLFPYIRAVAHGEKSQGVTLHRIAATIDEGDILHQYRFSDEEAATMVRAHASMMWRYPQALVAAIWAIENPATATRITTGSEPSQYFSTPDAAAMRAFFAAKGKVLAWRDFVLAWRNGCASQRS